MSRSTDMVWEVTDMRSMLGTYELDEDFFRGLNEAVYNGQTRLALEYSARVVGQLINHVMELEGRINVLEATEGPKPAKASTAKSRKIYKGSEEVTDPEPSQEPSADE